MQYKQQYQGLLKQFMMDAFKKLFIAIIALEILACTTGNNNVSQKDTGKTSSGVDSMPIVKPPVKDSGSMIITPPTGDSNIVKPDTNNNKK